MRRTLIGLVVAGAILVAGCGGDDDSGGGGGGGDNPAAQGDGTTEGFCRQFRAYDEQFSQNPEADDQEVIDAIRSLDPPPEIKDDFDTLLEGLDALQAVDTNDPEAQAQLQEQMSQYTEASTNIQTFVDENCGEGTSVDGASDDTTATTEGDDSGGESTEDTTTTTAG